MGRLRGDAPRVALSFAAAPRHCSQHHPKGYDHDGRQEYIHPDHFPDRTANPQPNSGPKFRNLQRVTTLPRMRPVTAGVVLFLLALIVGTFIWKVQTTGLTL